MPTLYDLTQEQRALREMADAAESPEEAAAIVDTLEASDAMLGQKAEGYIAVFRSLHEQADAREAEGKRLIELARIDRSKGDALRERLMDGLKSIGKLKLDTPLYRVTVAKGVPRVEIENEQLIQAVYGERRETITIDKRRLLDDLKAGNVIAGARLAEGRSSLRIK